MEKIIVNPGNVRANGNVVSPKLIEDYECLNCEITENTAEVNNITMPVFDGTYYVYTSLTLTSNIQTIQLGGSFIFTATLLNLQEQGISGATITLKDGNATIGSGTTNNNGVATITINSLTSGNHSIIAMFAGNEDYSSSNSPSVSVTVTKKTLTTVLSASPTEWIGLANIPTFTLTATVKDGNTPVEGITVTFKEGDNVRGTATTDSTGVATVSVRKANWGSYTFVAVTTETDTYESSTSESATVTVRKYHPNVTLSASPNTIIVGETVTFTSNIWLENGNQPIGATVTLKEGNTVLGTGTTGYNNDPAVITLDNLSVGTHNIVAYFEGNSAAEPANSSAVTVVVNDHDYSLSFSESSYATSNGEATLEVTLLDNNVPVSGATVSVSGSDGSLYSGITDNSGVATVTVSVSQDTTFTATYSNVSDSVTVEYCLFVDYGVTGNSNLSNIAVQGSTTVTDTGTLVELGSYTSFYVRPNSFGLFTAPFTVKMTVICGGNSTSTKGRLVFQPFNSSTTSLGGLDTGNVLESGDELRCDFSSTQAKLYRNGTLLYTRDYTSTSQIKVNIYNNQTGCYIKYKDLRIK